MAIFIIANYTFSQIILFPITKDFSNFRGKYMRRVAVAFVIHYSFLISKRIMNTEF